MRLLPRLGRLHFLVIAAHADLQTHGVGKIARSLNRAGQPNRVGRLQWTSSVALRSSERLGGICKAIIWDLDGVLVDSLGLRLAGLDNAAPRAMAPDEGELRRWLCHGPRTALRNIPGANASLRDFERFCRRVASQYLKEFAGVRHTLEALEQVGIKQGLVTSRTAADTERWLTLCGVPNVFQVRITYSDRLRPKPDPSSLVVVADRLHATLQESAYIGDTIEDGIACERAGMAFLLAGWGTPDVEEVLSAVTPDGVMESPTDVLSWVRGNNR